MTKFTDWLSGQLAFLGTDRGLITFGLAIFFTICISAGYDLMQDSVAVNLVTSLGVLIALSKYFYEKRKDEKREIIELVSFFRDTVLGLHEIFASIVRSEMGENHNFVKVRLSEPNLEYVRRHDSARAIKQKEYLFHNKRIEIAATQTLNSIEEFSLKVKLLSASQSKDLLILHDTFVEIVEDLAVLLLWQREMLHDETMYSNTVNLFKEWEPKYDRRATEQRKRDLFKKLGI